jgi:large repetitive protein
MEMLEGRIVPASTSARNLLAPGSFHPTVEVLIASQSVPNASGYTPAQITSAYGLTGITVNGVIGDGSGVAIAVVDAFDNPNIAIDLKAFDKQFNLPDPTFNKYNQSGQPSNYPVVDPTGAWEDEEALDVEWAHAIAPKATIDLVEADSAALSDMLAASATAANLPNVCAVSMSFTMPEFAGETADDSTFVTPTGHIGVTFLAATGDSGSPSSYPAYSPSVVAVGGTTLTITANAYAGEVGWSGSGGGTSAYEAEPAYQHSVQSSGFRMNPDVSFDADKTTGVWVRDSYNYGSSAPWEVVGGTSLATPCWAGIIALTDGLRVGDGEQSLDGASQTLPYLYGLPSGNFHDIISGSNGGFSAQPGYDQVTGIGSPNGPGVVLGLVDNPKVSLVQTSLPVGTAQFPYDQLISLQGGVPNYTMTYQILSGAIPAGINFVVTDSNLELSITGAAQAAGSVTFDVTIIDGAGYSDTKTYTLTINPAITISPTSIPTGTVDAYYDQTFQVSGGTGSTSVSYGILNGALPAGLAFTPNGTSITLSGTPLATGFINFYVSGVDAIGASITQDYLLLVHPGMGFSPISIPADTVGIGYTKTITASGGTGNINLSTVINFGSLPTGMGFSGSGDTLVLSGLPSTSGTCQFTVTATDSAGDQTFEIYTLVVNPVPSFSTGGIAATTLGFAYNDSVTASGGTGTVGLTYSVVGGVTPQSLGLGVAVSGSTLQITGTATKAGQFSLSIVATDSLGASSSTVYIGVVNRPVALPTGNLPPDTVNNPYSQTIASSFGTGPVTLNYTVIGGSVPASMAFTLSGNQLTISGTPLTTGSFTFAVTATDSVGSTATHDYTVTINSPLSLTPGSGALNAGTVGVYYSASVFSMGGTGTVTITAVPTGGSASPQSLGLTVAALGNVVVISGTPTGSGTLTLQVTATDAANDQVIGFYAVTINPAVAFSPADVPQGTVGTLYPTQQITGIFGTGTINVSYSVTSGAIPAGLSFTINSGEITIQGTPTAAGSVSFIVVGIDSVGSIGSQTYTLTINPAITMLPNSPLALGEVGVLYDQQISISGGTGALSVKATSLSNGLSVGTTPNMVIVSGVPSAAGTVFFTVTASDNAGATLVKTYSLTIDPSISLSVNMPTNVEGGVPYLGNVTAVGGNGNVTLSPSLVPGSSFPGGLSFGFAANLLTLSGTPSTAGSFAIQLTAFDALGGKATTSFAVNIKQPMVLSPLSVPDGTVQRAYYQTIAVTGGAGDAHLVSPFVTTNGSVPTGLNLTISGAVLSIVGTPTVAGSVSFTLTATDSTATVISRSYTLTINPAIAFSPLSVPATTLGTANYNATITASLGTGALQVGYSLFPKNTIPAGLTFKVQGNALVLSGTPLAAGTVQFTAIATDSVGAVTTQNYTLTVNPAPVLTAPAALANSTVNVALNKAITASGGTGTKSMTVAILSGGVPGISITPGANAVSITGKATAASSVTFMVTATDSLNVSVHQVYTLTINPPPFFNKATLPNGTVGASYLAGIVVYGGTGNKTVTYSIVAGRLPTGLAIIPGANQLVVTGKPTIRGAVLIRITATDAAGAVIAENVLLTV